MLVFCWDVETFPPNVPGIDGILGIVGKDELDWLFDEPGKQVQLPKIGSYIVNY